MAITRIHAIKGTLSKSIAYICNPAKTQEEILIDSFGCSHETAHFSFKFALEGTMTRQKITLPSTLFSPLLRVRYPMRKPTKLE